MAEPLLEFSELFDAKGNLYGAFISGPLWVKVKDQILPQIQSALMEAGQIPAEEPRPEPMPDFDMLLEYWDFAYPPTFDVACEHCGATTEDWRNDEPRKFRLQAANMGGLVNFECQVCKSRILKRFFKKHCSTECRPFIER